MIENLIKLLLFVLVIFNFKKNCKLSIVLGIILIILNFSYIEMYNTNNTKNKNINSLDTIKKKEEEKIKNLKKELEIKELIKEQHKLKTKLLDGMSNPNNN